MALLQAFHSQENASTYVAQAPCGQLGLILEVDDERQQAVVDQVLSGGPLVDQVSMGDILTHIDGEPVRDVRHLSTRCGRLLRKRKTLTFVHGHT